MANEDQVLSSPRKILQGDVGQDRPNSEAVQNKIGGSINYLLDRTTYTLDFTIDGYFAPEATGPRSGHGGTKRIFKQSEIIGYYFTMYKNGTASETSVNIEFDDRAGNFGKVFDDSDLNLLKISGGSNTLVCIGKDLRENTNIEQNPNGEPVQLGVLNSTIIPANSLLTLEIKSRATNARDGFLSLILREI